MRALLIAVSLVGLTGAVQAAPATQPMTLGQVHCHADRLQALLDRTDLLFDHEASIRDGAIPVTPFALLWTQGSPSADPLGLAYSTSFEKQLSFSLNAYETPLGRDPETDLLPTFTLSRNRLASDLLPAAGPAAFTVSVNPVLAPTPPKNFRLRVSNLRSAAAVDTKRGQGLAAPLAPCASTLGAADLHALQVLARVLRPVVWVAFGSSSESPMAATFAILYRGADATPVAGGTQTSFRLDAASPSDPFRRLAVEILIDVADDGALGRASMRLLPTCAARGDRDCSGDNEHGDATLQALRPVAAGHDPAPDDAPALCFVPDDHLACSRGPVTFDLEERLAGTRWLRP